MNFLQQIWRILYKVSTFAEPFYGCYGMYSYEYWWVANLRLRVGSRRSHDFKCNYEF